MADPMEETLTPEQWKDRGNDRYKAGDYAEAVKNYTKAIGGCACVFASARVFGLSDASFWLVLCFHVSRL